LGTLCFKFMREHHPDFVGGFVSGVLPNFLAGLAVPLVIFGSRQVLSFADFLRFTAFAFAAGCAYEVAQSFMPQRTFDGWDIAATAAGGLLAVMIGILVFYLPAKNSRPPR